jgi:hypothetical protein
MLHYVHSNEDTATKEKGQAMTFEFRQAQWPWFLSVSLQKLLNPECEEGEHSECGKLFFCRESQQEFIACLNYQTFSWISQSLV